MLHLDFTHELPLTQEAKDFLIDNKENIQNQKYDILFDNLLYGSLSLLSKIQIITLFKNEFNIKPKFEIDSIYIVVWKDKELFGEPIFLSKESQYNSESILSYATTTPAYIKYFKSKSEIYDYLVNIKYDVREKNDLDKILEIYEGWSIY